MTKRELVGAMKFLACMPQAYHSRGPEWIMNEMAEAARKYAEQAEKAPHGGRRRSHDQAA